jgi:hypothetical protein
LLVAALLAPAWLAGCSPTATYGTGQAPEMALFREVTGGILGGGKKEPIEYQPRAPLVLPPTATAQQLPPPAPPASVASADWPLDPDARGDPDARAALVRDDGRERDPRAGPDEFHRLKPLLDVQEEVARNSHDVMEGSRVRSNVIPTPAQRNEFQKAVAEAEGYGTNERRFLTDPPTEYRRPAPTAPAEFENIDTDGGGGGWLSWLLGG